MNNYLVPRRKIPVYKFIGEVLSYDEASGIATVPPNEIILKIGDEIEFYGPHFSAFLNRQLQK